MADRININLKMMNDNLPIYNSRIQKIYLEYLENHYPNVDIDAVLEYAGITRYQVEDPAHWVSQQQADRLHEILVKMTGNPNIAREAGRYAASTVGLGPVKHYAIGLFTLTSLYRSLEKIYPMITRGATLKAKKLGTNKIEIVAIPKPGITERPYQCENRIGTLESLPKFFTEEFGKIEHPSCFHKGDECCRYIITWERTPALVWKRIRNYTILLSIVASFALSFVLPTGDFMYCVLLFTLLTMLLLSYAEHLDKKEIRKIVEIQGNAAKDHLSEMNIRYNNALLVQEIGQATSTILDIDGLFYAIVNVMQKRLDFDRGMIMLAGKDESRLVYTAGYGYTDEQEALLRQTEFHLDNPESEGIFVLSFKNQKPFLVNDTGEIGTNFSKRSQELVSQMGVQSLICVPIVYEKEALGILTVDNVASKRYLTSSDMSLLMGVASQTAVCIINARSFHKLQENEERYRTLYDESKRAEEVYRSLLHTSADAIVTCDLTGKVTYVTPEFTRIFGWTLEDIEGKEIPFVPESESKATATGVERILKTGKALQAFETKRYTKSGHLVDVNISASRYNDHAGKPAGLLFVIRDVTERKRLEAQLQQAQKMEAIGTLAGGIAHDFNNILTSIFGYTEIASLEIPEESKVKQDLKEVLKAAHRAKDLVNQILAFSHQRSQERKPIQISLIVKEAIKLLRATLPTSIEIKQDIRSAEGIVEANPTQIHQVLMNLCTNAAHAMRENGGILDIRLDNVTLDERFTSRFPDLNPGPYVELRVRDTGCGMTSRVMERIFDPYFTTKEKGEGTGLGLAVVHGIMNIYGGAITVKSNLGEGSTFYVYLPRIERKVIPEIEVPEDIPHGNERILLIDDEPALAAIGKQLLEHLGYDVTTRTSSIEALELFRAKPERFDLVITDMTMPHLTGDKLSQQFLKIRPDLPIILCTGYSENITEERAKAMHIKAFAMKPLILKNLANTVRKVLDMET